MTKARTALAALLVAGLCSVDGAAATADVVVTYVSDGQAYFTLTAPDDWVVRTGSDVAPPADADLGPPMPRIVSMFPQADHVLWFGAWHARRASSFEEALSRFTDLGAFVMDETTVVETQDRTINGMVARIVRGIGTRQGQNVEFGIVLFEIAPETIGAALYLGDPAAWSVYGDTVFRIVHSLRPALAVGAAQ